MAYTYDFSVLDVSEFIPRNWIAFPKENQLSIDADIVHYMWDALSWIPSEWPHQNMEKRLGLDMTGPSIIWAEGAVLLEKLLYGYAAIFETAPETFTLKGGATWIEDGEMILTSSIERQTISVEKHAIISHLSTLADMASVVASSENGKFLAVKGL